MKNPKKMQIDRKKILLFLIFLSIFLVIIPSNVSSSSYNIEVSEDQGIIWKCNECDQERLKRLFGNHWDDNGTGIFEDMRKGRLMRWVIRDVDKEERFSIETQQMEEAYIIEYKKWVWKEVEREWGDEDGYEEIVFYNDPEDFGEDYIFKNIVPFILPMPFGDYLKETDLYEGYTIDARVIPSITCEIEENDLDNGRPEEMVKVQAMYTEKGIVKSYKLYWQNHHVLIDISIDSDFNNETIILPIIIIVFYIGLIYLIYRIIK
ncbi:MAG: hypothetical protein GF383_15910 [Candidatus Lokiarchaeota archaeon]|nr:hypothetical protein [Candidatus Lokiarchaeota archaeon]MBD3343191.1 hypothetical protein [Candidatus Lokiarchaeota archaeon]